MGERGGRISRRSGLNGMGLVRLFDVRGRVVGR